MLKRQLRSLINFRKNHWIEDNEHKLKIDPKIIIDDFDTIQTLHFKEKHAKEEEKIIFPFINIDHNSRILDLGCGSGRWGKILALQCKEYIGIDFSDKMLEKARKSANYENVSFICQPSQDYFVDDKYDLILMIGLITYLNDEDIFKISNNCRKMLSSKGRLIIRNVTLKDNKVERKVYSCQQSTTMKLLNIPGYQIIRRSRNEELSFFRDFKLIHEEDIPNTNYRFYVLE